MRAEERAVIDAAIAYVEANPTIRYPSPWTEGKALAAAVDALAKLRAPEEPEPKLYDQYEPHAYIASEHDGEEVCGHLLAGGYSCRQYKEFPAHVETKWARAEDVLLGSPTEDTAPEPCTLIGYDIGAVMNAAGFTEDAAPQPAHPWTPSEPNADIETWVFQALGAASMCWDETPLGVFDSTGCKEIGDALVAEIRRQVDGSRASGRTVMVSDRIRARLDTVGSTYGHQNTVPTLELVILVAALRAALGVADEAIEAAAACPWLADTTADRARADALAEVGNAVHAAIAKHIGGSG